MMAAPGVRARGRSRHRHFDLQLLECIAEALLRRSWVPCPAIPPPDLDRTSYMRPLDFDALGGCKSQLLIVVEQPAILLVQRKHHARYEACHEVG